MTDKTSASPSERGANRFLRTLSAADYELLKPDLHLVALERGRHIYNESGPIDFVYFVDRGIISLIKTMRDGRTVEVHAVGAEGIAGWNAGFGMKGALFDSIVQVSGEAWRIKGAAFRRAVETSGSLKGLLQGYAELALREIAQTAACNRLHSLEERCCRWLLIAHDSARSDTFHLTHEFLSMMLGVQRTGVSIVASLLQKAGFIRYSRGNVTITDRAGLEAMACECYGAITDRLALLYSRGDQGL